MCRAHCAQTHIFVLANHAYTRMCLKPGPGQISTGRNLLKWSIWRCSTTRLCFWNISVPGFGHSFSGKANGAQLHHTPMGTELTSHIWTPVCQTHHLAACHCWIHLYRFSLTIQWLQDSLSSYRWHKNMCIFMCLCSGTSFFCLIKPSTSVLSQKKLKNDHRNHAWLLLWQHHAFLHWI